MPTVRLPAAKHAALPWKNGLGVSRIIATEPPGAGYESMLWQIGRTEIVADCPFSEHQPVRVFNVIARRGKARASVEFLEGSSFSKAAGETVFAVEPPSLEAWVVAGPGAETCAIESDRGGRRVLVRISA